MERITERAGDYIQIKGCKSLYKDEKRHAAPASSAIVKLAAYEDTGFEPEEIMSRMADILREEESTPLTLEQLQKRDGKPIWVKELANGKPSYWEICTYNKYDLALYSKAWVAYDHESKEGRA